MSGVARAIFGLCQWENRRAVLWAFVCSALLLSSSFSRAQAAPLLADGSFEDPVVSDFPSDTSNCFGFSGCAGFDLGTLLGPWEVFGTGGPERSVVVLTNDYTTELPRLFTPQDGNQSIDLTGASNQGANGVEQTVNLSPGSYSLSFWLGRQGTGDFYMGAASLALLINGTLAATYDNNLNALPLNINWQQFTYDFTASGATTIAFLNASPCCDQNFVGLDNVSLAAVPIPNSLVLLLAGIGCLLLWGVRSPESS